MPGLTPHPRDAHCPVLELRLSNRSADLDIRISMEENCFGCTCRMNSSDLHNVCMSTGTRCRSGLQTWPRWFAGYHRLSSLRSRFAGRPKPAQRTTRCLLLRGEHLRVQGPSELPGPPPLAARGLAALARRLQRTPGRGSLTGYGILAALAAGKLPGKVARPMDDITRQRDRRRPRHRPPLTASLGGWRELTPRAATRIDGDWIGRALPPVPVREVNWAPGRSQCR